MSSLSLSSDVSAVNLDLAGEVAEVPPVVPVPEEPLPEAVVSSERLPPLMMTLPSLSFVAVVFPECLT